MLCSVSDLDPAEVRNKIDENWYVQGVQLFLDAVAADLSVSNGDRF